MTNTSTITNARNPLTGDRWIYFEVGIESGGMGDHWLTHRPHSVGAAPGARSDAYEHVYGSQDAIHWIAAKTIKPQKTI